MKPVQFNEKNIKEQIEKNLSAIIKDLPNLKMIVGIPGDKENKGFNIAHYAAMNNYGRIGDKAKHIATIPARPAFTYTANSENAHMIMQKAASKLLRQCALNNKDAKGYLGKLAMYIAGLFQKAIVSHDFSPNPPNKPSTIARKGSSATLIDTGTMIRAIAGWVTKR